MGFAREEDARRVLEGLPKRFAKYGLTLHPDKTRLAPFRRPRARSDRGSEPPAPSGTFDFLGVTHYVGRPYSGFCVVKRKTAGNRVRRAVPAIARRVVGSLGLEVLFCLAGRFRLRSSPISHLPSDRIRRPAHFIR